MQSSEAVLITALDLESLHLRLGSSLPPLEGLQAERQVFFFQFQISGYTMDIKHDPHPPSWIWIWTNKLNDLRKGFKPALAAYSLV